MSDERLPPLTAELAGFAAEQWGKTRLGSTFHKALIAIAENRHRTYDTATHEAVPHEELERLRADAQRLDALEKLANQPGGVLLHDGSETGRTGLGLRPGRLVRSLRDAIDAAQQEQSNDR